MRRSYPSRPEAFQCSVDGEGVPKISDFGLASRSTSGQTGADAERDNPGLSELHVPEQAIGEECEHRAESVDVYAPGAILYEMLTGRPPFLAASVIETLEAVRQSEPVPPRQLQSCTSARPGDDLFEMPGESRRDAAYASARALADDLDRFAQGRPILARPASAWKD